MGKKEISDKVIKVLFSQLPPNEPSQLSSSTEEKSMIRSRPITQLPRSQKSPRSSAICGHMSNSPPRTDSKSSTRRTRKLPLKIRPSMKRNTARSSARKRRRELPRRITMNDWFDSFFKT